MRPGDGDYSVHRPDFPRFCVISPGCHGLTHSLAANAPLRAVPPPIGFEAAATPEIYAIGVAGGFPNRDETLFGDDKFDDDVVSY